MNQSTIHKCEKEIFDLTTIPIIIVWVRVIIVRIPIVTRIVTTIVTIAI